MLLWHLLLYVIIVVFLKGFIRDFLLKTLKSDDKITPQIIDERTNKVVSKVFF